MEDEFAGSRLPDLPNAGYSTQREKALSDVIMMFVRGVERDRVCLLSMVCDGKDKFRGVLGREWRSMGFDTDMCDAIFGYLELLAGKNPHEQLETLLAMQTETPIQRVWRIQ